VGYVHPLVTRPNSSLTVVVGLTALLSIPLAVAAGVAHSPRWYPLYDLAMTEMRVRDVGLAHPPLVGLPGRLGGFGLQGSHPGALSFYALAPTYRLLGSTAWGMEVGVAVLNAVAVGVALVIARRRGGLWACLGVAAGLAVAMRAFGPEIMTHAWNPFMPVLWWVVFLLAVWSVLDDDLPWLPVAVFAGSFCAQTHISYVVMVGVLGGLAVASVVGRAWQERGEPAQVRRAGVWLAGSAGLALLLWAPALVEELRSGTGNLTVVVEGFRDPLTPPIGLRDGLEIWFSRLDPWGFVTGEAHGGPGATLRAVALLLAWAASVVLAWRRRDESLLRLDLVLAVSLVVGLLSLTRISGVPWFYLHLWGWGTAALLAVATVWGLAVSVDAAGELPEGWRRRGPAVLAVGLVLVVGSSTWSAAYREEPVASLTEGIRGVAPAAVETLRRDGAPGGGPDGRYLVQWVDPVAIGDQGWSLLSELERVGLDAYVTPAFATGARDHRVLSPGDAAATATVTLVVGPPIEEFRHRQGAVELSYFEPRTRAEQARFAELRELVEAEMAAAGVDPGVLDVSLFLAGQQPGLSPEAGAALAEMQQLGLPLAVFVEPT